MFLGARDVGSGFRGVEYGYGIVYRHNIYAAAGAALQDAHAKRSVLVGQDESLELVMGFPGIENARWHRPDATEVLLLLAEQETQHAPSLPTLI